MREFFEKISRLKPVEYKSHPSDRILIDHLSGKLRRDWRFSDRRLEQLLKGEPADWTHTDVSAHVLICARCARRVARLKSPLLRIVLQARESMKELAQRMKRPKASDFSHVKKRRKKSFVSKNSARKRCQLLMPSNRVAQAFIGFYGPSFCGEL